MHLAVVVDVFPFYIFVKPIGILKCKLFIHFAEIKTSHHGDPFLMQQFQDPADHVFP